MQGRLETMLAVQGKGSHQKNKSFKVATLSQPLLTHPLPNWVTLIWSKSKQADTVTPRPHIYCFPKELLIVTLQDGLEWG